MRALRIALATRHATDAFIPLAPSTQGLRTLRLLSREPGVSFADVVDEWLAWSGTEDPPATPETMRAFVAHLCGRKGIPDRFYQAFGALELPAAAARMRSATRTTSAMAATP